MTVEIDLTAGEVRIGGAVLDGVRDASGHGLGALTLSTGAVIAPLTYGERSQLCAIHRRRDSLAAATLAASVRDGAPGPERAALEALALHLAGARVDADRPGFADVAMAMRRVFGWNAADLLAAPAHVVDELAAGVVDDRGPAANAPDGGWVSYELRSDAPSAAVLTLDELRGVLADDLLRRGSTPLTDVAPDPDADHHRPTVETGRRAHGTADPAPGIAPGRPVGEADIAGAVSTDQQVEQLARRARPSTGAAGVVPPSSGDVAPSTNDPATQASAARSDDPDVSDATGGPGPTLGARPTARPTTPSTPAGATTAQPTRSASGPRSGHGASVRSEQGAAPADPADPGGLGGLGGLGGFGDPVRLEIPVEGTRPGTAPTSWPVGVTTTTPDRRHAPQGSGDARVRTPDEIAAVLAPVPGSHPDTLDLADRLAAILDDEADIRGLLPW